MGTMASQITSLTIVYSTVYSGADQSKHQSSASLAFVWGIPSTNGQYRGKCFHLMTSSCINGHQQPTPGCHCSLTCSILHNAQNVAIKIMQTMSKKSREVGNPWVSLLLADLQKKNNVLRSLYLKWIVRIYYLPLWRRHGNMSPCIYNYERIATCAGCQ